MQTEGLCTRAAGSMAGRCTGDSRKSDAFCSNNFYSLISVLVEHATKHPIHVRLSHRRFRMAKRLKPIRHDVYIASLLDNKVRFAASNAVLAAHARCRCDRRPAQQTYLVASSQPRAFDGCLVLCGSDEVDYCARSYDSATESLSDIEREIHKVCSSEPGIPGFPQVVDVAAYKNLRFVVFDGCAGPSLRDVMADREQAGVDPFEESVALDIFEKMLRPVAALHARGIAHTGLRLARYRGSIDSSGVISVVLASFECCHDAAAEPDYCGRLTQAAVYEAPETRASAGPHDAFKLDSFALAVCLFALLTCNYPKRDDAGYVVEECCELQSSPTAYALFQKLAHPAPSERISVDEAVQHLQAIQGRAGRGLTEERPRTDMRARQTRITSAVCSLP